VTELAAAECLGGKAGLQRQVRRRRGRLAASASVLPDPFLSCRPLLQSARPVPRQAQGAEYGLPASQIRGGWLHSTVGLMAGGPALLPSPTRCRHSPTLRSFPSMCPFLAARGGEVTVKVPADIADRFNRAVVRPAAVPCMARHRAAAPAQAAAPAAAAPQETVLQAGRQQPLAAPCPSCLQNKHAESGEGVGSNIDSDTHKSGMEPLTERARNLTEVAHVGVRECAGVWVCGAVGMRLGGAAHVFWSLQYPHALGHIGLPRFTKLPSLLCCAVLCCAVLCCASLCHHAGEDQD
jgi:hypothetical protein